MADVRRWVAEHEEVPDDFEVSGHLPRFPRHWAHVEIYTNTLLGLYVDDPEDFV
ncbi:hypothetical protein AB0H43_02920 [Hamadaea sp. NPDC050747]|uniref:hypothetical protein n=1 Tax=Hamadaea sp. NPDC050747 TaxID=3155789 RepID=UPI0033D6D5A1